MRIFKNKRFAKFAKEKNISDTKLCEVVKDAEAGLIDADYGGGVIKQRIARTNEGKSGRYRTIILYRKGDKAFFVYGFPKKRSVQVIYLLTYRLSVMRGRHCEIFARKLRQSRKLST